MSPELLDPERFGLGDGRPTKRSDTYALGMVILEVLTGKPPFPDCNGMIVMRKVVEGEHPGRPQGGEEVWFTDDLWEMLEQCWSPKPEKRPTIDAVLQCLKQGSAAWQPLPPDSDDYVQSDSNDQSCFILSHDPSVEPSTFLHLVLDLTHQTAFVAARIDPQDDDRTSVLSRSEPRSVHAGQGSHQPSPRGQQRSAELPVSAMSDMADTPVLHGNRRHVPGTAGFHQCQTTQTSASPGTSRPSIRFFYDIDYQLSITLHLEQTTFWITDLLHSCSRTQWKRVPRVSSRSRPIHVASGI